MSVQARDNRFAQDLFTPLPERYDALEELLSFRQNRRWRRAAVDRLLDGRPARVLDVATGTAGVAVTLARRGGCTVVGVDLTPAMLREGLRRVRAAGLTGRVALVNARAEQLPVPDGGFDGLLFTYLLRYVDDPAATLRELGRAVRPGGRMASLEFYVPPVRLWRWAWVLYTRLVLPLAGWATGGPSWRRVGAFLGPNIEAHYRRYPLAWTERAWAEAGFVDVGHRVMSLGGGLVMWGTKAGG